LHLFLIRKLDEIMRPKIVILTLVGALSLVGLMVAFKGLLGDQGGAAAPNVEAKSDATPPSVEGHSEANPTGTPPGSEEARAGQIQNEVDQITELVAGGSNPSTTSKLLAKLNHPEAEVRKAAVDAIVQLNDTNAVPGLELAAASAQDPHEKVALMDAAAYLKLPEVTANVDGRPAPDVLDAAGRANALNKARANLAPQSGKRHRRGVTQPGFPANPDQSPATPSQATPQAQ
jgi:hypothetical protein